MSSQSDLIQMIAATYYDPLEFVMMAYPWGEVGPLRKYSGPDVWQKEFLIDVGREFKSRRFEPWRDLTPAKSVEMVVSSGHGIGKSGTVAWLVDWIMSTRPGSKGTVTANTSSQLDTKTWAEVQKWTRMSINADWWDLSATVMRARADLCKALGESPQQWMCSPQTCREENSEAFAGQHAPKACSFYIMDEASAIPEAIWDVSEGGLTDGGPARFAFGNPTRNTGKFYRICFGSEKDRWNHRSIDSRTAILTNKEKIKEWEDQYGADSDFFRVRVRGMPPGASELQYIDRERVEAARTRPVETLRGEPLIAGFDASGGGSAWNVIRFRRGKDARSVPPPIRITGQAGRDRSILVAKCAEILADRRPEYRVAALFADSAFGSPIIERLHTLGFENAHEVNFGGPSADIHCYNRRAQMWSQMKDWLLTGGIEDDENLASQLQVPGYDLSNSNKLIIEPKHKIVDRGEASPDDADALALTFAEHVAPLDDDGRVLHGDTWGRFNRRAPASYGKDSWML